MKLSVRKFELGDLETVNKWLEQRDHHKISSKDVPLIGFIAHHNWEPIAIGFLRLIEGRNAIFDFIVTNPEALSSYRDLALNLIAEEIIKAAKRRKILRIIAYSVDASTLKRSLRHGFVQLPHTLIALDLKSDNITED